MTPAAQGRQGGSLERLAGRFRRLAGRRAAPATDAQRQDTLVALARSRAEGVTRPVAVLFALSDGASAELAAALRDVAGGPVVEVDMTDPSAAHIRFTALGPFALIVDAIQDRRTRARRFQDVFHHVAPGGALVVRDVPEQAVADPQRGYRGLSGLLGAIEEARRAGRPGPVKPGTPPPTAAELVRQDAWSLAEAIQTAESVDGHLLVTSRGSRALAKVAEDEIDRLLEVRGDGRYRVLDLVPAESFTSRCVLNTNAVTGKHAHPRPGYDAPPATLREYHDVQCNPGQVVSTERVILPDTYRHNQRGRLKNRYTVEVAPRFAELLDDTPPPGWRGPTSTSTPSCAGTSVT